MHYVSLFTGIGGFDFGFDRAGMKCASQVENDKNCLAVLDYHWPNVDRSMIDVKEFGRETFSGSIDLICGGFPCQDVSIAGRREGLDGKRSGLWFEFLRIITELKPKWVVIENVPGLLSSNEKRDFAAILSGLGECGYWWAYRILDAQYFGVAQRRRRVFVVGCLGDWRGPAEILFERESSAWDSAPSREAGQGVADPITKSFAKHHGRSAGKDSYPRNLIYKRRGGFGISQSKNISPTLESEGGTHQGGPERVPMVLEIHGGSKRKDRPDGGFYVREMPTAKPLDTGGLNPNCAQGGNLVAYTVHGEHSTAMTGDGDAKVAFETKVIRSLDSCGGYATNQGGNIVAHGLSENQRAELRLTKYSRQITSGGGKPSQGYPAALTPFGVRRLTPLECERLQGFPNNWTAINGMSDSARYRMLGNAVAVPVATWLGQRIMEVEVFRKASTE